MRRRVLAMTVAAAGLFSFHPAPTPGQLPRGLADARQLVVVTTTTWDTTSGMLWRFERATTSDSWHATVTGSPIVVGRTGLAWGTSFDQLAASTAAPHKHEGDGKSPAGVFPLDTVFGFAPHDSMSWVRMPYVQLLPGTDCVDDTASAHYNTVVSSDAVSRVDWASAEHMRQIGQYRMGVIVGYNAAPPIRGRGSCIFLHIWGGPRSTTAGCTALDATELSRLVGWLDRARRPVIVQLPATEYDRLRARWRLPRLAASH
jgi:L,D-peptidoglycan transpeptidase YkuD (ErfK/YbiS/YcfS/YnhG family)